MELNVYIETIVRGFSRYNKYSIGEELREKSRMILYQIYKIYFSKGKKNSVEKLRNLIEELKITIFLAKELKSLKSFKQFEVSSALCFELTRQAQGWLKSLK